MKLLKRFASYYKPHKKLFILDFGCAIAMSGLDLLFPRMTQEIIDNILPSGNMRMFAIFSLAMLIFYILRGILNYIVIYWGHVLGTRIEYDMRNDIFMHTQKLSFSYFDNTKTGSIMSRIVSDLSNVSELAHHGPEDLFVSIITLIGSVILMSTMNFQLAMLIFAILPFMIWFLIIKNNQMREVFKQTRVRIAEVNSNVEDTISGIRVVKAFANEKHEEDKFKKGNRKFKNTREKAFSIVGQFFSGVNLSSSLMKLLVIVFGGYLISKGDMTVGALVGFLMYVEMFLIPIRRLTSFVEGFQKGMAGFSRFDEIMDIDPDIEDHEDAIDINIKKGEIEFKDVKFEYNKRNRVLDNFNLKIKSGETIALVGPSGGGKTTICSLIPRFYEVTEGTLKIDGVDIKKVTQRSLREGIGIVQQDVFLFSGTIKENIAYGRLNATDKEIVDSAKKANAHEFIMNLEKGYDTYIGEKGVKLSGGQKQRISLARIFLKDPQILILDEATSALDNQTEVLIQKSLEKLSENRTSIIIAHRLSTIKHCDRIVVITDNGIEEVGTHDELINKNKVYAKLYKAQFHGFMPDQL